MSSDDEELAGLRAARAARLGGPGAAANLAALKDKQRKAQEADQQAAAFYAEPGAGPSSSHAQRAAQRGDSDEDGPVVVAPEDAAGAEDAEDDGEAGPEEDSDLLMHDPLRAAFPMSFGQQEAVAAKPQEVFGKHKRPSIGPPRPPPRPQGAVVPDDEGPSVGPPRPPQLADADEDEAAQGSGRAAEPLSQGMEDGEEDEEDDDPYQLPISHEALLGSSHQKAVTCLDIDHSGSRLLTGSLDYTIRIYDFNGMKSDLRAFRELEPQEGHPVLSVSWSPSGDAFMVVTGSSKAKLFDRNGLALGEFVRGDMYIRDQRNTKGHVTSLTGGQWHPTDRNTSMTCSDDGTVRIWDTASIEQKTVVKPTLSKPGRMSVTACAYGADGRLIGSGLRDGSIQLWNVSGRFGTSAAVGQVAAPKEQMLGKQTWSYVSRSNQIVRDAHEPGTEITSLAFSRDGTSLISRSMDATLKLWDLRKFTAPVHAWDDLPCAHPTTKCIFSPDEQLILTGVSTGKDDEGGAVVFFDKSRRTLVRKVGMPGSVTGLGWHDRLNQIFAGVGNRKSGGCRALYSTTFSERGVMLGAARAPRKPSLFDFQAPLIIKNPHALPMFKDETHRKRKREDQIASAKARVPDAGMAAGAGKQGRIGTTSKTLLTQHLMKQRGALMAPSNAMDPRESLLRHEGKKDEFDNYLAAYSETQPKRIYAQEEEEEEQEEGS